MVAAGSTNNHNTNRQRHNGRNNSVIPDLVMVLWSYGPNGLKQKTIKTFKTIKMVTAKAPMANSASGRNNS
ncbi:MAG: hypothetical protein IJE99_05690 [Alistipes sp.]|nr:hypothetical protein [Alistipes sp.]